MKATENALEAKQKKLQFWFLLPNGNWELGKILSTSGTESIISLPNDEVLKVKTENLVPANPDILDGVDDLMQLSYLNEPSVLYNLQHRYNQDLIYTKAGPVLVAINPFKKVPLYGNGYIESYKRKSIESPHVYAITDTAIREMIRDEVNQSIIISGESGAGKTETAKIAMQYLAALGGGSGIEYEILKTSPILEAFGNAKTLRNDNSSCFGKLIEIHFSETGKISGAKIQTFLLEKSRVVQCTEGERSYHIFYQLCAGAPPTLREVLNLKSASEYKYLSQSSCYSITGVNDAEQFRVVVEALDVVHISKEDQQSVFAMLAAVLWLGNISFTVIDNENHVEPLEDEGLFNVARLIGCDVGDLKQALSIRKMRVGNDNIVQKLKLSQAIDTRDALAKSVYACLFEWLVEQINKSLAVGKRRTGRSISILDIYGFESFDRNSFEQFCINYANERLRQHFNRHLFKLEQEEYIKDGIDWAKIEFEDNQDCLTLFEKKPLGLLSLLDEESTFPNGTDLTFANKLKQHLNSNSSFRGEREKAFSVSHYAGEVTYDTTGFLEKNRDLLHLDSIQLLLSCSCHLPQIFASNMLAQSEKPVVGPLYKSGGADSQKLSVATKFKGQLFQLMQRLESTTPHFIRCVKPNNLQSPRLYEQGLVLQQLRCCGVLEVVRISRSGFPTRMSHQKFAKRYGFLLSENVASQDPLSVSVAILHQFGILPEMYQVGYTKLFFRTGQIGVLEDTRNRTLHGVLCVQSCFRGHRARCYLKEFRRGVATLQSFIRGEKARREYEVLLWRHRAAIVIQKKIKYMIARKNLKNMHEASIVIQSVIRGWLVRRCSGDIGLLKLCDKKQLRSSRNVVDRILFPGNWDNPMGEQKQRHRILMVSDFFYPNFGGVENHIYYLSQCLLKLGHKVVVLTHAYGARTGVRYMTGGLKVYYVPWKPFLMQNTLPTFYGTLPIIRTILIREKISLVHGHQAFSTLCHEALMHARTMGYKVVFTDHSLYGFADVGSIHMNKVLQFTLADVSQAICVSHTSKENTVLRSGLPPEKVFVIPNAVDTAMFKPAPQRPSGNEIIIVVISRLVYRKGADLLVEVIPEVCHLNPNVRFVVGGDGPKRVRLEEMREKHSLQDRVQMLGAVPHALVRSLTEAFCIAILEAASCGLLTVSTRVGGVPEVLPDDMIVLAKPDPTDMVQAIKRAISILPKIDPQIMHNRMKELYSWHDVARRTEIVYDRALQCSNQSLVGRLSRYLSCGAWAGKLFCLVMIIDFVLWRLLELWQPAENIEEVPEFTISHHQD